jgi:hypothetical protein
MDAEEGCIVPGIGGKVTSLFHPSMTSLETVRTEIEFHEKALFARGP